MALANYTDLQASVAAWLNRSDLTAVIPDFIAIAENLHSRDLRLRKQIITTTLTTVSSNRGVTLPSDFLEFENVSLLDSPERQLTYATVEQLDSAYPNLGGNSEPSLYTIEADQILFGPTPDSAYVISILYYARFSSLSISGTNWLMTNHPQAYLYASLMQACLYIKDKSAAGEYKKLYDETVMNLQRQDDTAQHSGSSLRVRII